ncbi:MAG: hypothetical protein E6833_26120, partial [Bradyrhizobium sp.]|nr:hypothetical protein [Bradyrhizobium sp.]
RAQISYFALSEVVIRLNLWFQPRALPFARGSQEPAENWSSAHPHGSRASLHKLGRLARREDAMARTREWNSFGVR